MKTAIITLLVLAFISPHVLTIRLKNQFSFGTLDLNKKQTGMSSFLQSLMKVADVGEFVQVAAILDRIKIEFNQVKGATQNILSNEEENYNTNRQTMQDTLDRFNSELEEINSKLEDYQGQKTAAETAIQDAQRAINQNDEDKTAEITRRGKAKQSFEESQKNIDAAVAACGQILNLLEEIKEKDSEVVGLSLLQEEKQKIQNRLEHIQEKISKIRTRDPVSPFLNALVEVAQGDLNAEIIEQISNLVRDLQTSLLQEKQDGIQADEKDAADSKGTIDNLENTIYNEKIKLNTNQESLVGIKQNIQNYSGQAESKAESINTAQQALENADKAWDIRSGDLRGQISRLEDDVNALTEASDYLNGQSLQTL